MATATATQTLQIKHNGTLGNPESFCFVTADVVADYLSRSGLPMSLTIGLSFRNPRTRDRRMDNKSAIQWLKKYGNSYTLEAYVEGDIVSVTALSGNDLF